MGGQKISDVQNQRVHTFGTSEKDRTTTTTQNSGVCLEALEENEEICRCTGYRGIPVHLRLGHFNGPVSA
jgi:hypothetical protein